MGEDTSRIPGNDGESVSRRQQAVTWVLVVLSLFVSLGMAEWSKRTAASEPVVEAEVLDQAAQATVKPPERDNSELSSRDI